MTSFAPGASKKEMGRVNKHLYGDKMGGGNAPMGAAANAANAARQQSVAQAAAQKSAFGGMGKGPADVLRQMGAAANAAMGNPKTGIGTTTKPMPGGGPRQGPGVVMMSGPKTGPIPGTGPLQGLGTAMGNPKTGIGTTTKPMPMPSTGGPKPMSGGPRQGGIQKQLQFMSDQLRGGASGSPMGLGAAMSGPKTGIGTAMGMNKMAGAGAALGKSFGMKSGGAVGSASKRADGIATKGKTKGTMVSMKNGGKAC